MILSDGTYMETNEYNRTQGWDVVVTKGITWLDVFSVLNLGVFPFWGWFIYNYWSIT